MYKNNSQSIQQLLVAEKKAEDRITQARKRKNMRLKQAKDDAITEITNFRVEKEMEFKEFESKFAGSQESRQFQIEKDTEKAMKEMDKYVMLNKDTIIKYLIDQIYAIECEVHENFQKNEF